MLQRIMGLNTTKEDEQYYQTSCKVRRKVETRCTGSDASKSHPSGTANRGYEICKGYQPSRAFYVVNTNPNGPFLTSCYDKSLEKMDLTGKIEGLSYLSPLGVSFAPENIIVSTEPCKTLCVIF